MVARLVLVCAGRGTCGSVHCWQHCWQRCCLRWVFWWCRFRRRLLRVMLGLRVRRIWGRGRRQIKRATSALWFNDGVLVGSLGALQLGFSYFPLQRCNELVGRYGVATDTREHSS